MAMFFFHIVTAGCRIADLEGSNLGTLSDARDVAIVSAREMLADRIRHGEALGHEVIEITDGKGHVLDTVCIRDVLNSSA